MEENPWKLVRPGRSAKPISTNNQQGADSSSAMYFQDLFAADDMDDGETDSKDQVVAEGNGGEAVVKASKGNHTPARKKEGRKARKRSN